MPYGVRACGEPKAPTGARGAIEDFAAAAADVVLVLHESNRNHAVTASPAPRSC
jgi:hypothetical protein